MKPSRQRIGLLVTYNVLYWYPSGAHAILLTGSDLPSQEGGFTRTRPQKCKRIRTGKEAEKNKAIATTTSHFVESSSHSRSLFLAVSNLSPYFYVQRINCTVNATKSPAASSTEQG